MKLPRNQNVWLWGDRRFAQSKPVSSAKSFKLCWNPSLKLLKGSEWDDILQQGETTSYEAIKKQFVTMIPLTNPMQKVKSFSNDTDAENEVYVADNTPVSGTVEESKRD